MTSDHRPGDKLICQEQDSLETEPPRAEVEEIFEAGAEQLHHHHVVVAWEQASQGGYSGAGNVVESLVTALGDDTSPWPRPL